jgi:hypothetical protein
MPREEFSEAHLKIRQISLVLYCLGAAMSVWKLGYVAFFVTESLPAASIIFSFHSDASYLLDAWLFIVVMVWRRNENQISISQRTDSFELAYF